MSETARYIVVSVSGYPPSAGGATRPAASYSVLDNAYAHREVARFYAGESPGGDALRSERAQRECARLNALDRLGP